MTNSIRWVLFLVGSVLLILCVHYILVPLWPTPSLIGWRPHHVTYRGFPWGSFVGLLAVFGIGFILYKLLFPTSGSESTGEKRFCPYCGRDFQEDSTVGQEASSKSVVQKV